MTTTFRMPAMPAKYKSVTFAIEGAEYSICHSPFNSTSGRFTLRKPNGDYFDFNYGSSYAGYTSRKEAYAQVKNWIKKFYIK